VMRFKPEIARSNEDLPAPFAPRIAVIKPSFAPPEKFLTALMAP